MSEVFDLDRDTNIKNRIDATGKKWVIYKDRGTHLLYAKPEPGRSDSVIPKCMQGAWTKRFLLEDRIDQHVKESWDKADELTKKTERRLAAQKEAQRKGKYEEAAEGNEVPAEEDHNEELAGRPDDARSKEEEKEEAVVGSLEGMPYDQLLLLAKEQGIRERKKADIIKALTSEE